jgi:predicted TIM-barrel fold metal-dependent hydrolase
MIDHPDYEPFWAAAEDLDIAIGFHEDGSSGMPTVGIHRRAPHRVNRRAYGQNPIECAATISGRLAFEIVCKHAKTPRRNFAVSECC